MDIDIINQNLARASLAKAKKPVENPESKVLKEKQLKEATDGFEAIFINTMLKNMRSSLPGNAVFAESNDMNIYQSMYDQYLSEDLARGKSSVGISEYLFEQLKDSL